MSKSKPGSSRVHARPKAKTSTSTAINVGKASASDLKMRRIMAKIAAPKMILKPIDGIEIRPEHAVSWHGKFRLDYKGVAGKKLDDTDGSDEVAIVIALLSATQTGYTREVFRITGESLVPVDGRGLETMGARRLFDDEHRDVLLFTAVMEDDDGSAAAGLDQTDLLVNQAIIAATKLRSDDEDPLDTLDAMIQLAKFSLGSSATAPSVHTQKIQTWHWDRILDQRAAKFSRVPYRILTSHTVGNGRYDLFFDVPRPSNHKPRRLVKVDVRSILLTTPPETVKSGSVVHVCVGSMTRIGSRQPCASTELKWKFNNASEWKPTMFYRWTRQANRQVNVAVEQWSTKFGGQSQMDLNPDGLKRIAKHSINVRDSPVHIDVTHQGDDSNHAGRVHFLVDY